ncbi:MAG: L-2-amino-thiazoline-4-carboxylic acid hydrolase [Dehalococcoidia bacterium]|nr:L-2-amino-thiazoline-4-carboxylic acid hydrolase [Dehalococcoidia bacterium]
MTTATDLPLLERRRIEAAVLVPLIRAFQTEFGEERTNEIVGRTIREIAHAQGVADRDRLQIRNMDDLAARSLKGPTSDGSLVVDVVEQTPERYGFNVTTCKFVEMYEELGAGDLGPLLSCGRDFAYFEGLAPGVTFSRTQTRMEGAAHCDFRYHSEVVAPQER